MYPISFVLRSFPEKFPATSILSLLDFRPDRQSLLQHLLRAGADLASMWENDVLMVNRQANRCGEMEDHRSSPPSQKEACLIKWRVL